MTERYLFPLWAVIYFDDGSWTAYDTLTIANNVGGEYGGSLPQTNFSLCFFVIVLIISICFSALYLDYSALTCYEAFILSNNTGYYQGGAYVYETGLVFNGPVTISGNKATYSDGYTGGMLFVCFAPCQHSPPNNCT